MTLQQFLAKVAVDPGLLASYIANRDRVMREAGLAEEDQAALKSGNADAVIERIGHCFGPIGQTVTHTPPPPPPPPLAFPFCPWPYGAVAPGYGPAYHVPPTGTAAPGGQTICVPVVSLTIWPAYITLPSVQPAAPPVVPSGQANVAPPAPERESAAPPPVVPPSY